MKRSSYIVLVILAGCGQSFAPTADPTTASDSGSDAGQQDANVVDAPSMGVDAGHDPTHDAEPEAASDSSSPQDAMSDTLSPSDAMSEASDASHLSACCQTCDDNYMTAWAACTNPNNLTGCHNDAYNAWLTCIPPCGGGCGTCSYNDGTCH